MEHFDYDENEFENEYESPGKENQRLLCRSIP